VRAKPKAKSHKAKPDGDRAVRNFHYVYILVSENEPERHYTGLTDNLEKRLAAHNAGQCAHTAKYRPWKIETAIAFRSREKAAEFERHLKSHSGRAFASKHF
jgi:predicted GIY-YIG superfamily endonuclease